MYGIRSTLRRRCQPADGQTSVDGPFTLVVDEEAFDLVVVALGREIEWRLVAEIE